MPEVDTEFEESQPVKKPKKASKANAGKSPKEAKPPKEKKEKVAKPKKEPGERKQKETVRGMKRIAPISFGVDEEGVTWDFDTVPLRMGALERFGLIKDGMTVNDALKAGVEEGDLRKWRANGYIVVPD